MDSTPFAGDRLGKRDLLLATLAGIIFTIVYLVFAPKGMEPGLWEDLCIAAGLRPPATLFPGVWRLATKGLISFVGINRIDIVLRLIGCVIGGVCVSFVYLCTRQILALLCRVKSITPWNGFARHISFLATLCFGAGDSMWQIVAPVTPGAFLFLPLLVAVCLFLRWLVKGGLWRILAVMVLSGIVAAESTAGLS